MPSPLRRPTGRRRGAVVLVTAALLAAACSSTDSAVDDGTPAPSQPDASAPVSDGAAASTVTPIDWTSCGEAQCATVSVPVDYGSPDGLTLDLAVLRRPATGERLGSLFFNFGGPGAGAADVLRYFPVPGDVREHFDLIGMDPRGVAGSTPLDCGLDPQTLYAADPTIEDDIDVQTLLDVSRRFADDCTSTHGELLAHVGTRNVARDIDTIRAAMGDDQINYLGFSYGTSVGQAYASLFPDRVRTMILDGVVDPAPSGIAIATQQAVGFETALANWAEGCEQRPDCRFDDPFDAVNEVLALAERGVPSRTGVRALGPGEVAIGLALPLYSSSLWPRLDAALADALDGDGGGMVALADEYVELVDFSIYFAVSCLDASWPRSTDEFLAAAKAANDVAPRFGEAIVNDYIRCAVWPVDADPLGAITAQGAPPIVIVSTTGDPATPYENGVTVAERLASGVLVSYDGAVHTIVFQGDPCIDRVAIDYLIDLVVPPDGDRC